MNCDVIVDDLILLGEPVFWDGPVATTINSATGFFYVSAAGNEGNRSHLTSGTWEGDFRASGAADPPPLYGGDLHDFGDGGNSILVELAVANPPLLTWAEFYDSTSGIASTDFDIYDMDGALTVIYDASLDLQDGSGGDDFPIELIGGGTFSGERLLINRSAVGTTSSLPMMHLNVFGGELDDHLATSGSTFGHNAAAGALSVTATPAAASFDGITPNGPYPNRVSTPSTAPRPPRLTLPQSPASSSPARRASAPARIRSAILSSTIDIEASGIDRDSGAGIVIFRPRLCASPPGH